MDAIREIYLEAAYDYACAGRAISSDQQREYKLSLVSIKRNEPEGIEDELRVSCSCKGFRMRGKQDCPHWEGLVVKWAAELRRQGAPIRDNLRDASRDMTLYGEGYQRRGAAK